MSKPQIFNTTVKRKPLVLIVPLDWGLGHASRCIPIISYIISIGSEVIIASEGAQKAILMQEFPELKYIDLSGYRLRYGYSGWHTRFKIFAQSLKILTAIKNEKKWLDEFLKTENVDLVISDNRYGLYNNKVPSVFMTHQLSIRTGLGRMADRLVQKWNYRFIEKFSTCWIPDEEGEASLAGQLSHPQKLPSIPVKYIGLLSRFSKWLPANNKQTEHNKGNEKNKLLIILSGPEPQRSAFEKILLNELKSYLEPVVFVRGLPEETESLPAFNQTIIYNHLSARELYEKAIHADIVISRSGYSTIMDMMLIDKKCILVATPGQAEQEYLSDYLSNKHMCITVSQKDFRLLPAIEKLKQIPGSSAVYNYNKYQSVIDELIKEINTKIEMRSTK